MLVMWIAVKKSLPCNCKKVKTSDVHDPKPRKVRNNCCKPMLSPNSSSTSSKPTRDVIPGNRRLQGNPINYSPLSVESIELIDPVTHPVRLDDGSSTNRIPRSPLSRSSSWPVSASGGSDGGHRQNCCRKCGESLTRQDAEAHHLSKHAVTEVLEGDSPRKIIEIIFKTGWKPPADRGNQIRIEKIFKVHNSEIKLAHFEEYRETVKSKANRLQHSKRHPRCSADGNELLRFYGTTISCQLGHDGFSTLCSLETCNVCCILRHGFSKYKELNQSVFGVFTTSTSEAAYKSIEIDGENSSTSVRKALILCRVIAGRVHKPMSENSQDFDDGNKRLGFDSLAGNLGTNRSHIEELYVLNSSALLPCFVIVCKP